MQQGAAKELAAIILNAHPQQAFFLLGSTTTTQRTTTVFNMQQPSCISTSHYFILSLVTSAEQELSVIQDKIENTCKDNFIPVTCLALNISQFNRWLGSSHPFALTIFQKAQRLDKNDYPLVGPVEQCIISEEKNLHIATMQLHTASRFMAGAKFYMEKHMNSMAAFNLHQCTELALRSILQATTYWSPNTHNLDKLIRYAAIVVHKVPEIFSRTPDNNLRQFKLLQSAYIDARYKMLAVTKDDLADINNKVKALLKLARLTITNQSDPNHDN